MLAIGSDHGGYELKKLLKEYFDKNNIAYKDFGCNGESCDYPEYAKKVCGAVLDGTCEKGIVICGTGIGISIAANKIKGIRAALCTDTYMAKMSRKHNDANILALGGRVTGSGLALEIADTFIHTEFSNIDRHKKRIEQITEIEE